MKYIKNKTILKKIALPLFAAILLFAVIRPINAQILSLEQRLSSYLLSEDLEVGVETVEGQDQIYYLFEDQKIFITEGSWNNKQPKSNGEYITYVKEINGQGQIFLYHVLTKKTVQLTSIGPNLNPSISTQGKVVWEGWTYNPDGSGTWQIFVFDGTKINRITQGDISINASIDGEYVLYTRKNSLGEWRSEVYSILDDESKVISFGPQNKGVKLVGQDITFTDGGVFPLRPADLFLFDIGAMEEIINNATESAQVEGLETSLSVTPTL